MDKRIEQKGLIRFLPETTAPIIQLQYTYGMPFQQIALAMLRKNDWESKTHLTTITNISQPDEDTFVFYRRYESIMAMNPAYEKIVYSRKDNNIQTFSIIPGFDGIENYTDRAEVKSKDEGSTHHTHYVIDDGGAKSFKLEKFKVTIEKVIRSLKFMEYERQ